MIKDLKKHWRSRIKNEESNLCMWNNMAEGFRNFPVPKWDKDEFLKLLDSTVAFSNDMNVLDIGCGSGIFSIALSERVSRVTAIDVSPKMLEYARFNADKCQRENIDFICVNWKNVDLLQMGWNDQFDLVIAHNTPAVSDTQTFEKMIGSSRDYCFFAKPTRRTDSVLGKIPEVLGFPGKNKNRDDDIIIALSILWCHGLLPEMIHLEDFWKMEKPVKEACEFYANRLKVFYDLDLLQKEALENYLRSVAVDNIVYETTNTAITILAWRNNGKFLKTN